MLIEAMNELFQRKLAESRGEPVTRPDYSVFLQGAGKTAAPARQRNTISRPMGFNMATGLPMVGGVDVAGNFNGYDNTWYRY